MKNTSRILILILVSLVLLAMAACSDETSDDIPATLANMSLTESPPSPEASETNSSTTLEQPHLSYEDAVEICNAWLDDHPDVDSSNFGLNSISRGEYEPDDPQPPTFTLFDAHYYELYVASDLERENGFSHWLLVHEETGEVLSVYITRLADSVYTNALNDNVIFRIETLDDWYSGNTTEPDKALLSIDEALSIYNDWYANAEDHVGFSVYRIEPRERGRYIIFGEEYYYFGAVEYWFNILVHTRTGEMLHLMTSDGRHPATSIFPLEG